MENISQTNNTINFIINNSLGQNHVLKVLRNEISQPVLLYKQNIKFVILPKSVEGGKKESVQQAIKISKHKCSPKLVHLPDTSCKELQKVILDESVSTEENAQPVTQLKVVHTLPELVPITVTSQPIRSSIEQVKSNLSTAMSNTSRRRLDSGNDQPTEYTTKKRKHADKLGKGLRHFSMKVCEKVRNKGFTSYNEVADELVLEFTTGLHGSSDNQQYDQKNIRRRVYDALNVLMAMNIISKEKKEIRWLGLPTNSVQECSALEKEKQTKLEQIQKKTQQLQELILQHISFKSLIERNKEAENKGLKPSPSSAIHLPFIVVNTSDKALIDCSISNDKTEYMFNFNKRFQIHDDIDILKRMGLLFGLDKGECSEDDIERAKQMAPKSLENYVEQMGRGIVPKIASYLEETEIDETVDDTMEEETLECEPEVDEEPEDAEMHDFSDDSSEVDV